MCKITVTPCNVARRQRGDRQHVERIQQVLQELLELSQCRPTVHAGFHNAELCISLQFRNDKTCSLTSTKTTISLRINIFMYLTISMIALALRRGLEAKHEVVCHSLHC